MIKTTTLYYNPSNEHYDRKPYVGIVVTLTQYSYFIPLSSAKEKYTRPALRNLFHFVREEISEKAAKGKWVTIPSRNGKVWHILAAINVRRSIPVKEPFYSLIDLHNNRLKNSSYGALLQKEYHIIQGMYEDILADFEDCYAKQMKSGVQKYCCNFKLLESVCDNYTSAN